jgi:hypothetical protein
MHTNNVWHELIATSGSSLADECSPASECRVYDEEQRNLLRRTITDCVVLARKQAARSGETAVKWGANFQDRANHARDIRIAHTLAQVEHDSWSDTPLRVMP